MMVGWRRRIDDDKKYGGKGKTYNRNAFIFNICFGTFNLTQLVPTGPQADDGWVMVAVA